MLNQRVRRPLHAQQQGLSLVELMVGIAVGMFVVAAAATLVSTQLVDNRRMLLELQVQQDLRATADIITRDLRRIGAAGATSIADANTLVWDSANGSAVNTSYALLGLTASEIQFSSPRQIGVIGPYGYKLETTATKGWISSRLPSSTGAAWQHLTDSDVMKVTAFSMVQVEETPIVLACPKQCPLPLPLGAIDTSYCWPTLKVRSIEIDITAQALSDPSVIRRVRSKARLRNDLVEFNLPSGSTTQACPS